MALWLRDPVARDPFYEFDRILRPRYNALPVRVRRADAPSLIDDIVPITGFRHFDQALSELQSVMDGVNEVIGQYQKEGLLAPPVDAGGMVQSRTEDGNLQFAIDVSQYKPEEIQVKLCDDNLVVEGATESSDNNTFHKAHFKRWMKLPEDCKRENIKSSLTPDKKLVIHVPMAKPITQSNTRSIPIEVQNQQQKSVEGSKGGDTKSNDKQKK